MEGTVPLEINNLYVMLMQSTYTTVSAAGTAHDFRNDITTYEVTAGGTTGYTTGGVSMGVTAANTVTYDLTNNLGSWDSADVSWASAYITARFAAVYKSTGAATTDPLVCCFDFGQDYTASNGTFTIQWSTSGLMRLS